jgi:ParB-like chromosome segregation protein Spo0J
MKELRDSIDKDGIQEPIKYVEYNGSKYVVDGHHRLEIAKERGMESVPAQKVDLPFKGYRDVGDLGYDP